MYIAEWLGQESGHKKILVTRNVKNATRLIRKCNARGIVRFNTEVRSILDIARETVISYYASMGRIMKIDVPDDKACCVLLYELLAELKEKINFLPAESLSLGTASEILRCINTIRTNKTTRKYIGSSDNKTAELKELIDDYENKLDELGKYDYAMLLKCACSIIKDGGYNNNHEYGLLAGIGYSKLELEFVRLISGRGACVVYCGGSNIKGRVIPFRAYDIADEIGHIADYIEENNIPLGQVNIYYTNDVYESFLSAILGSREISFGFISGYSAMCTDYLNFMCSVLKWAEQDYLYSALESVVTNPKLDAETGYAIRRNYTGPACDEIIWGLDTYKRYISRNKKESFDNAEKEKNMQIFLRFLEDLTGVFEGNAGISQLYERLCAFTDKYTYSRNEEKKYIGASLKAEKDALIQLETVSYAMDMVSASSFIRKRLEMLNMKDAECTDSVNIMKLGSADTTERKYNFITGLSASYFNGNIAESPVLSDKELNDYVIGNKRLASRNSFRLRKQLMNMLRTADEDSLIFISYSKYDTVNLREMSASNAFIDIAGDNNILEVEASEITGRNIKITDSKGVWDKFNSVCDKDIPEYSAEQPLKFSATSLQTMLECPLKYYYEFVLHIPRTEFRERNSGDWLTPLKKGLFVHKVLEEYVTSEFIEKENAENKLDKSLFDEIFERTAEEYKEKYQCDSLYIYNREKSDMYDKISKYLEKLHSETSDGEWMPVACEKSFADAVYKLEEDGKTAELKFNGTIDRLDVNNDGVYRLIDYKSNKKAENGKYCQHFVYPLDIDNTEQFVYEYIFINKSVKYDKDKTGCLEDCKADILKNAVLKNVYDVPEEVKCDYCKYKCICTTKMG